jgi:anti-anti-sigma regulatory factor
MQLNKNKKSSSIVLPDRLDVYQADPMQEIFVAAISHAQPINIKAGDVEQLDTACAQVIMAAKLACAEANIDLKVQESSEAFDAALDRLGLLETLTTAGK